MCESAYSACRKIHSSVSAYPRHRVCFDGIVRSRDDIRIQLLGMDTILPEENANLNRLREREADPDRDMREHIIERTWPSLRLCISRATFDKNAKDMLDTLLLQRYGRTRELLGTWIR